MTDSATSGWNEYDLSEENWFVSGDFWIGLKAYAATPPIAMDYDVGSNTSMHRTSNSEWSTINDWNLAIRVFLDCESQNIDECGVCDGDNSTCSLLSDTNFDGIVDILDIVQIVNYITGNLEFSDDEFIVADYNADDIIDILDIVQIINYILR